MEIIKTMSIAFVAISMLTLSLRNCNGDSTDSSSEKSGLVLYTDHGTGVQYVGTTFGAIAVRVDRDGKPVTVKP